MSSIYGPGLVPGSNDTRFIDAAKFRAGDASATLAGIASTDASVAYDEADSLITIYNSASASAGEKSIIRVSLIRLVAKAVNASATDFNLIGYLDVGDCYTSGGTALTPVNTAYDSAKTSKATIYFGALVTTAASATARRVFTGQVSKTIFAADDVVGATFGYNYGADNFLTAHSFAIPPGHTLKVHGFGVGQVADPKFSPEIVWTEHGLA